MFRIFILFILFINFSCLEKEKIEKNLLLERDHFFQKKGLSKNEFQYKFYIRNGNDYTHYVLKCYKIKNNDSIIIYLTRDDTADYFIEVNDNFKKYQKHK